MGILRQERAQADFRRGSKGSNGINGRPPLFRVLPCVYITNMWFGFEENGSKVFNIGPEVRKTGVGGRRRSKKLVVETITGLPPFHDLPSDETEVPAKNERKPIPNEFSGAKTRNSGPRKLPVKHRKWYSTSKWVSQTPVSLKREQIESKPKIRANGDG